MLGKTGLKVSLLGFGSGGPSQLGQNTGLSNKDQQHLLNRVIDLGINLIDSSEAYGDSEKILGKCLQGISRNSYVIATKTMCTNQIGEIRDPYDNEETDVLKQPDGSFIVEGSITIYDLEEETDIEFPEERDYDTLAGFILETLTEIPTVGEHVKYENMVFKVQTVENNRIGKVQIQKDI